MTVNAENITKALQNRPHEFSPYDRTLSKGCVLRHKITGLLIGSFWGILPVLIEEKRVHIPNESGMYVTYHIVTRLRAKGLNRLIRRRWNELQRRQDKALNDRLSTSIANKVHSI